MLYPYANSWMITAGYKCNAMYDNEFNDLQWADNLSFILDDNGKKTSRSVASKRDR